MSKRYLLFGASTTFGATDYENGGWSGHLRRHLDTKQQNRYFHNLAISGNRSHDLLRRMEAEAKERIRDKAKEDWVMFISIGTNDARVDDGEPVVAEEGYRQNIDKILTMAKDLVGQVIFIGGQPVIEEVCNPWKKPESYYLNERIRAYTEMAKEVAAVHDVPVVEYEPEMSARADLRELYDDGLHPNAKGHKVIFDILQPKIDALLD